MEQQLQVGGLSFCYEEFGARSNPSVLLIMGLGTQMIGWTEEFCESLVTAGFHVVRFDNRDIGLSSKINAPPPSVLGLLATSVLRLPLRTPYTLHAMANDAVALLDGLGIERAHIVGASMGGMIAQLVAANHSERVLSLTSIMSTSGARYLPRPSVKVTRLMLRRRSTDPEQRLEEALKFWAVIGSPDYPPPEAELRTKIMRSYNRNYCPEGYLRQLGAISASGHRVRELKRITVPTLVLHGESDVLVPLACGRHTAQLVPGARLISYKGMGHDIPPALYGEIIDAIAELAQST